MIYPPLNLPSILPCSVLVQSVTDPSVTYWIKRGVVWAGIDIPLWAFSGTGVLELEGREFKGNVVDWSL